MPERIGVRDHGDGEIVRIALRKLPPRTGGQSRGRLGGLTVLELLVVLVALASLALVGLSRQSRARAGRAMNMCADNLRQVAAGLRGNTDGRFLTSLPTDDGGARDLVNGGPAGAGDPSRTFWVFGALSNQLTSPRSVVCPADRARVVVSNFQDLVSPDPRGPGGRNASVSYFVNLDAVPDQPSVILTGDRNLSTMAHATRAESYDAFFGVEHRIRPEDVKPGGVYAGLGFQPSLHSKGGRRARHGLLALADGSVQFATGGVVRHQILASTNIHRLIFPFVPGKNE